MSALGVVVGIPILFLGTGALAFAYVVALGFSNEGCRFGHTTGSAWPVIVDWSVLHGMFLLGFAFTVLIIANLVGGVRIGNVGMAKLIVGLATAAYASAAMASLIFALSCRGLLPEMFALIRHPLELAAPILAATAALAVVVGWWLTVNEQLSTGK